MSERRQVPSGHYSFQRSIWPWQMRGFAGEMQKVGAGLYSEVLVTEALDTNATAAGLDWIVERIFAEINPRADVGRQCDGA